uniref:Uncharacterized protein n=1 Tax=Glossina palpalis gambiensis TaxID=67801 RepID=A0A1B0BJ57_9MUSC
MNVNEMQLRDFDEETEDTDSETELLVRHVGNGGSQQSDFKLQKTKSNSNSITNNNRSRSHVHHNNTNRHSRSLMNNHQRKTQSFLSQLFDVVSNTTFTRNNNNNSILSSSTSNSHRPNLRTSRAAPVRHRNEQNCEYFVSNSISANTSTTNTINNAAYAARFNHSSKTYHIKHPVASMDSTDASPMGTFHYSDTPPTTNTTAGLSATSNSVNATTNNGLQTVVDPDNGSTTVFYQKNRRKSKKRSLSNLCKVCLCR